MVDFISKYFRGREISGIAVWERGLSLTPTHPPFPRPAGSAGRGERMGLKSGPPKKVHQSLKSSLMDENSGENMLCVCILASMHTTRTMHTTRMHNINNIVLFFPPIPSAPRLVRPLTSDTINHTNHTHHPPHQNATHTCGTPRPLPPPPPARGRNGGSGEGAKGGHTCEAPDLELDLDLDLRHRCGRVRPNQPRRPWLWP